VSATAPPIVLYTDLISPFGYLGALGLRPIAAKHGRGIDWRPFLLGVTVMQVMGLPPVPETPLKGPYAAHDCARCFRLMGVPYNPPPGRQMQPLPANRALAWLRERDPALAIEFGLAVAGAHWSQGRDMSTVEAVAEVGEGLGIPAAEVAAAVADPAVKARLRAHVEAAVARGVFGAPSFDVDGELFWGHDRLGMVDRWLETGGW
jgi:2-hydroxychromene-2-carboxylate isomerase